MKPSQSPSEEETAFWVALNLAQRSIYRSMDAVLKAEGLPPLRWYDILWALERAGRCGVRPFELERSLLFEQSNLSRLLRRLVDEGLAKEAVFKDDRRGKVLKLTAKGRRIRERMWKIYGPLIRAHVGPLDDAGKVTAALRSIIVGNGIAWQEN
ncbi:MAG: MarR family winged helix-turn-helix transcriptional regulator [Pseudomonadota bacterium]